MDNSDFLAFFIFICVCLSFDPFIRCCIFGNDFVQLLVCAGHLYVKLLIIPTLFYKETTLFTTCLLANGAILSYDASHMANMTGNNYWFLLLLHLLPIVLFFKPGITYIN